MKCEQKRTFGRRNRLHSFHCMHCALHVSRAFRCPPPFCSWNFDEPPPFNNQTLGLISTTELPIFLLLSNSASSMPNLIVCLPTFWTMNTCITLLLLLFASTKFCDLGFATILRVEPGVLMSAGCSNVGHLKIEGVSFGGIWPKFHRWCSNYWAWHAPNSSAIRQSPRGKKEPFSTGSGNTSKSKFLFELTWDNSWSKIFF